MLPVQRGCFRAMVHSLRFKVTSLRIVAERPAGPTSATVLYTVDARASIGGHSIPMFPRRPGHPQWLVATMAHGHWYVNVTRSASLSFALACP